MKNLLRVASVVLATAAVLVILWWFRMVLVSFFLAVMISAALAPAFTGLEHLRIPRRAAIGIVYAAILAAVAGLCLLLYDQVLQDLNRVVDDFGTAHEHILEHWPEGNAVQRYFASMVPDRSEASVEGGATRDKAAANRLLTAGSKLTRWAILTFLAVVVSIYWSMEYERLERLWLLLLSPGRRAWARRTWRQIQAEVGGYLRSELLLGFFVALVIGSTFKWLGFPYPVVLGLIIAGTWLVPWMGAILAVLAVWGASLLNFMDVTPVAAVARGAIGSGITLLVFVILKVVVEPKVLNREPYSSLLLIVITVGAVQAIGAIGIIVGPVISNAVQILVRSLLFPSSEHARQQPPADFEALQQRLDALQDHVAALDRANRLPLENMLNNVRNLITQARQTVRHPEQEKNRMAP